MSSTYCPTLPTHTVTHSISNSITLAESKRNEAKNYGLTKESRATTDQVLDQRTNKVLSKLKRKGIFTELDTCISTGKEANVYRAIKTDDSSNQVDFLAIKIYKTSILVFKDRSRYVEGEFRFRTGCTKGNPRKMVKLWCEKEMRNLNRMSQANHIRSPKVLEGRDNVIAMTLIGIDPSCLDDSLSFGPTKNKFEIDVAPKLKDAFERFPGLDGHLVYKEVLLLMWEMYNTCKLVHGDLSEYNLLHDGKYLVVIDVSQSVEHDHPESLEFLKRDIFNVNRFFSKIIGQENIPSVKEIFEWIITSYGKETAKFRVDELLEAEETGMDEDEDRVFVTTPTMRSLYDLVDLRQLEEELAKASRGEKTVVDRLVKEREDSESEEEEEEGEDSEDEKSEENENSEEESSGSETGSSVYVERSNQKPGMIPAGFTKEEWKKKVKEEKREKRKHKIPKKEKKKEEKKHIHRK
jgi:RIO kinase 1